jgi:hypothetical protein
MGVSEISCVETKLDRSRYGSPSVLLCAESATLIQRSIEMRKAFRLAKIIEAEIALASGEEAGLSRADRGIASLLLPGCGMNTGRFELPDTTGWVILKVLLPASLQGAVDGVRKFFCGKVCSIDQRGVPRSDDLDRGDVTSTNSRSVLQALPSREKSPRVRQQNH